MRARFKLEKKEVKRTPFTKKNRFESILFSISFYHFQSRLLRVWSFGHFLTIPVLLSLRNLEKRFLKKVVVSERVSWCDWRGMRSNHKGENMAN